MDELIAKDDRLIRCPAAECRLPLERLEAEGDDDPLLLRPAPDDVRGPRGGRLRGAALRHFNRWRLRCPRCDTVFCSRCMTVPYHSGYDCEAFRALRGGSECRFCDRALVRLPGSEKHNVAPVPYEEDQVCLELNGRGQFVDVGPLAAWAEEAGPEPTRAGGARRTGPRADNGPRPGGVGPAGRGVGRPLVSPRGLGEPPGPRLRARRPDGRGRVGPRNGRGVRASATTRGATRGATRGRRGATRASSRASRRNPGPGKTRRRVIRNGDALPTDALTMEAWIRLPTRWRDAAAPTHEARVMSQGGLDDLPGFSLLVLGGGRRLRARLVAAPARLCSGRRRRPGPAGGRGGAGGVRPAAEAVAFERETTAGQRRRRGRGEARGPTWRRRGPGRRAC